MRHGKVIDRLFEEDHTTEIKKLLELAKKYEVAENHRKAEVNQIRRYEESFSRTQPYWKKNKKGSGTKKSTRNRK